MAEDDSSTAFYIVTRPVAAEIRALFPSEFKPFLDNPNLHICHHWGVLAETKDHAYTFELHANGQNEPITFKNGLVLRNAYGPTDHPEWTGRHYVGTLKHTVTLDQLTEAAKNVSLNGKPYHVVNQNCQLWAKEFIKKFGLDAPQRLVDSRQGLGSLFGIFSSLQQQQQQQQREKRIKNS
jgi:hypothetical protein